MKSNMQTWGYGALVSVLLCVGYVAPALAQAVSTGSKNVNTTRATEVRADKLGSAQVLGNLLPGVAVKLLSVEGGWAWVEVAQSKSSPRLTGWVRANAIDLSAGVSKVSAMDTGRQAAGNSALTLGVRSLPARNTRHALIIGISRYEDPATPPLPGARIDRESATQMAQAMQVPLENIRYLQDEEATGEKIRGALRDLTNKVQEGDRVFIHYSGHGTRYNDAAAGGCVEALLPYDGEKSGMLTNREMADLLKTITNKTDKLFVMYDACHSGGLVQSASAVRTRGIKNSNDEGTLRPKFASISEECGRPVNIKTRNLLVETATKGVMPQDIIHISASRDNEISFDDEIKGGLATQFMRDCMLRDAKDLDGSGAVSIDEIKQCAQDKIDKRMAHDANFKPHHLMLSGNAGFVPAWFSQASLAASAPVVAPALSTGTSVALVPLTGQQALEQMYDQRNAKHRVQLSLSKDKLKIGQDKLQFAIRSDRAGYVYVAMAGSDNESLVLLFPNDLDKNNTIEAGQTLQLPRPNWVLSASGPVGVNHLMVVVSDAPRDLSALAQRKEGPFATSLNDAKGRANLGELMTSAKADPACAKPASARGNPLCSDAYGAAMVALEELK
jgi:hypothetical protein